MSQDSDREEMSKDDKSKRIVRLKRIARKFYKAGNGKQALSTLKNALYIALENGDEVQVEIIRGQIAAVERLERSDCLLSAKSVRKETKAQRWNRVRELCLENETRSKCKIYLTADVKTFRHFAEELPTKDDVVLELGSSTGKTTEILAQSANRVFGVEKCRIVGEARDNLKKFENVTIIHEDAQNIYQVFEKARRVSMVFIDVGGNVGPWRTVWLAERYMRMFSPKALVMRNNQLSGFISSLEYCEKWDAGRWS